MNAAAVAAPKKNKASVSRVEMMDNYEAAKLRAAARNTYESMNYTNMEMENIPLNNFKATPNREVPRGNAKFQTPNKPTRSIFGNVGNYPSNMPRKIGIGGAAKKTLRRRKTAAGRTRRNRK